MAELSEQATAAGPQAAQVADAAAGTSHSLPAGLLAALREFRAGEMAHAIRITNLPLDIGFTRAISLSHRGHFSPCFPDYVMFLCLRNPDLVPLLISAPDSPVPGEMWDLLSKPGFPHRASPSHGGDDAPAAWVRILFGQARAPGIRVNLANLDRSGLGGPGRDAVCALETMLRRNATEISLHVADCVILDNVRTVHGRKPFQARFDGSDRWLKRAIVSRDFRRCLAWSPWSAARTLGASYV